MQNYSYLDELKDEMVEENIEMLNVMPDLRLMQAESLAQSIIKKLKGTGHILGDSQYEITDNVGKILLVCIDFELAMRVVGSKGAFFGLSDKWSYTHLDGGRVLVEFKI